MDRLSSYRTTWTQDGDKVVVCYVATNIVRADADTVTLDSGGWQTVTTKRKMNQAAVQFGLGFTVFQRAGEWYVLRVRDGYVMAFKDGMTFSRYVEQAA